MTKRVWIVGLTLGTALVAFHAATAQAQILGTFRWQTQPFCNVVSLTIEQQGGIFQLNGGDDLCGAGPTPVTGTATMTAAGVAFGFTVAPPDGRPTFISAAVSLSTLGGSWTDGEGNVGTFVFNPASATGAPRPAPASRVLSATVGSGGGLIRGVGVVSSRLIGSGFTYEIVFNRDISACAVVASVASQSPTIHVMYASTFRVAANLRAIRLVGFAANGSPSLVPFNLLVACP